MPVHPILYFLYHFFKLIIFLALRGYFRQMSVAGLTKEKTKGPLILISNHPATLLDPLNAAVHIPRIVHFLANASLFKTRFSNWFFTTFFCIRIERYQDTKGKPLDNEASFEMAINFLNGGGCLYIAPEGASWVERRLRKIKTGTARIALSTEARNGFTTGLRILPVGINYEDPTRPRSDILTIYGTPVEVDDYRDIYEKDPVQAVVDLSETIRERLSGLILDTADEREDRLLKYLEVMAENERSLGPLDSFKRSKAMLARLAEMRSEGSYEAFALQVTDYFRALEAHRVSDGVLAGKGNVLSLFLQLLLVLPLGVPGLVLWTLPVLAGKHLHRKVNDDIHWSPTYKYLIGMVVIPLLLGVEIALITLLTQPGWLVWVLLAGVIPAGLAAEFLLEKSRLLLSYLRLRQLRNQNGVKARELTVSRSLILREIAMD